MDERLSKGVDGQFSALIWFRFVLRRSALSVLESRYSVSPLSQREIFPSPRLEMRLFEFASNLSFELDQNGCPFRNLQGQHLRWQSESLRAPRRCFADEMTRLRLLPVRSPPSSRERH